MVGRIELESEHHRQAFPRVALCVAASMLADDVHRLVGTDVACDAAPGDFIRHAQRVAVAAQDLVQWAAILERERGVSWEIIGEQLGINEQAARQRFGTALDAWRSALDELLPAHDEIRSGN